MSNETVTVRLPPELRAWLEAMGKQSERPLSAEVRFRLERSRREEVAEGAVQGAA